MLIGSKTWFGKGQFPFGKSSARSICDRLRDVREVRAALAFGPELFALLKQCPFVARRSADALSLGQA